MERIIIDPNMYNIESEELIISQINFFKKLIQLVDTGRVVVVLYEQTKMQLYQRELQLFPLSIHNIKNESIKESVLLLNTAFNNVILKHCLSLDIDSCSGNQEYHIEAKKEIVDILNNNIYSDLMYILLLECYKPDSISSNIVKGDIDKGLQIGNEFTLCCSCETCEHKRTYTIVELDSLLSENEKAYNALCELRQDNKIVLCEKPEVVRGQHHNFVQKSGIPTDFSEISRKNRIVLSMLRYFGMYKIVFERGFTDTSKPTGTIIIDDIVDNSTNSIIKAKIYLDIGSVNVISLYFPKEVGNLLGKYFGREISYQNISNLKDRLAL